MSSSISRGVVRESFRPHSAAGPSCPRHDRSGINHACAGAPKNPHAHVGAPKRYHARVGASSSLAPWGASKNVSFERREKLIAPGAKADIDLCAQGHQLRSRIARVSASTNQVQSNSNNLIGLIDAQHFSKETQISLS